MTMRHHKFAEMFPIYSEQDLQSLADDIRQNGQRVPIVLDSEGLILDGRNRAAACELAGVKPTTEVFSGPESEKLKLVVSLNMQRRNLNESQRAMMAARLKPEFDRLAKDRKHATLKKGNQQPVVENLPARDGRSRDQAGDMLNVSGKSVDAAGKVIRQGCIELVELVASGKLAVSAAVRILDLSRDEQKKLVVQGPKAIRQQGANLAREEKGRVESIAAPLLSPTRRIVRAVVNDAEHAISDPQDVETSHSKFISLLWRWCKTIADNTPGRSMIRDVVAILNMETPFHLDLCNRGKSRSELSNPTEEQVVLFDVIERFLDSMRTDPLGEQAAVDSLFIEVGGIIGHRFHVYWCDDGSSKVDAVPCKTAEAS